jgi:putative Mg2+ transporter-C (MgtC) family protein
MGPIDFAIATGTALLLGLLIGLERQWRQHPAGLRTNALVALGACLFVGLPRMADPSAEGISRLAAQVVSGIGFLGGGVILREGVTVRGMATAATIWCSAAVGALSGAGFPGHAAAGAAAVLILNVLVRPISHQIDAMRKTAGEVETQYRLTVVCSSDQTVTVRAAVLQGANEHPRMTVHGLTTQPGVPGRCCVAAEVYSAVRDDPVLEELVGRLLAEAGVVSAGWERLR